jgi:uncharacterized protein
MADKANDKTLAPEFEAFYANVREKRLAFPRCADCGRFHWYPMKLCPHCRSAAIEWQPVAGRGTLWSFTEVTHRFDARYTGEVPYIVGLVEFPDAPGVRLITHVLGMPYDELACDMPVAVEFEDSNLPHPRVFVRPAA